MYIATPRASNYTKKAILKTTKKKKNRILKLYSSNIQGGKTKEMEQWEAESTDKKQNKCHNGILILYQINNYFYI